MPCLLACLPPAAAPSQICVKANAPKQLGADSLREALNNERSYSPESSHTAQVSRLGAGSIGGPPELRRWQQVLCFALDSDSEWLTSWLVGMVNDITMMK